MSIGAVTAFIVTFVTGNPWLGLLAAIIAASLISVIHAFASITLQASQVVSGLALTMLGLGISGIVGKPYIGKPLTIKMQNWVIPVLSDIPVLGPILFDHSPFAPLTFFISFPLISTFCIDFLLPNRHRLFHFINGKLHCLSRKKS